MSGGHDNHGHGDHGNESPTEKTKKGFGWLGMVFWGFFLTAAVLLVGFFIWRSFFHDDAGSGRQYDPPAAAASAPAPASIGFCVGVANQRFVAPVGPRWTEEFPIETGCRVMMDASVLRHLRMQCRDEGDTTWRNQTGNDCNGDYRRYQSKLDRPVRGLMIFRPW